MSNQYTEKSEDTNELKEYKPSYTSTYDSLMIYR